MKVKSTAVKSDLFKRLRRVEGQVRGVQKMLDEDRDCKEIIQQLTAIRSAVQNARLQILRGYAKECLLQPSQSGNDHAEMIDELMNLIAKVE